MHDPVGGWAWPPIRKRGPSASGHELWGGSVVIRGVTRDDPAAELRDGLIAALVEIPFMAALSDRRLLVNLVRRDFGEFAEVTERSETRLHVVEIVLTCLGQPRGLRALHNALMTMAPEASGTRRATQLIESASLLSLLPDGEAAHVRRLLRRAELEFSAPEVRARALAGMEPGLPAEIRGLVQAFDHLAAQADFEQRIPAALVFTDRIATMLAGQAGDDLRKWVDSEAARRRLSDELNELRAMDTDNHRSVDIEGSGDFIKMSPDVETTESDISIVEVETSAGIDDPAELAIHGDADARLSLEDLSLGEMMSAVASTERPAGRLPLVWGDVPQRNPNFTGRGELLEQLHSGLMHSRQTAVLPQALHGMGGVGKSHIAIEYVHRHSSEYDLIWWVSAEQVGQILDSLTKLALRLELDVEPTANAAVPAVREALSTGSLPYKRWLLVFDNAGAPDDVQEYFPTGGAGKVLVTSRDLDWSRVTEVLEVDVFAREESIEFLRHRSSELSVGDADRIADALGDLPLAVEHAAAWRVATGMPVDEYLHLLDNNRIELLDAAPSPDYRRTVAAAWKVSLDRLRDVNEGALQLLQVCSFFAPEPIARNLLVASSAAPITPALDSVLGDSFRLSRAIRDIQRYALARIDHRNNTLQIHRLIQAVLVSELNAEERETMRQGAHTLLANNDPKNPSVRAEWARYQALYPHVLVSKAVESPNPRVQELVDSVARYLYYWGDHTGSEELIQQAYDYRVRDRGETDLHTLSVAKWLGWMLRVNGKYADAKTLNERTLELYRLTYGDEDDGTIDAMTVVASDLLTTGDSLAARELANRAYETAQRAFGDDDPATLRCAHSLAVCLRFLGEYAQAEELDRKTYEHRRTILGPDHDDTLNTLNGLVIDMRERGLYIEARKRQEEVYLEHVAAFGPDSPSGLRAARALAVARRKAGDHPGAFELSAETLERYQRRYGDTYPAALATAVNYAIDLRHAGDFDAAQRLGEVTLTHYRSEFGELHSYTLAAQTNLAIVLRLQGEIEQAHTLDKKALEGMVETLGVDHPTTLTCATNLASDLYALGENQAAYELDIDTLARSERVLGAEHPSTLSCSVNLALDLRQLGRVNEADRILADTLTGYRRVLGERHPATLNALQSVRADCDVDPMPL